MTTANQNSTTAPGAAGGVTRHVNDKGMEQALGIGKNGKQLNTHAHDLQEQIEEVRDEFLELRSVFIGRDRHDFMRNGLLGEIVARTPIFIYDLPELKQVCNTAFVDRSGKMYIADTFARRLLAEHAQGLDSLNFLIRHEADHLRRLHLARMVNVHHAIANQAQDIRINIDLTKGEAAELFASKNTRDATAEELVEAARAYLQALAPTSVGIGCAMNIEDYKKYDGLSEEAIATLLMQDWKEPPKMPNREVSFEHIMEGAAQEADSVKVMLQNGVKLAPTAPPYVMTPAELSGLAQELRRIGKAKANPKSVSDKDLQDCYDRLGKLKEHQGLVELDMQHARGSQAMAGTGGIHSSGKTGDAYLDALRPSERVEMAMKVLEKILQPAANNGMPGQPQNGGLTIKDLERGMGRGGKGQPGQGQSQPGGDPSGDPSQDRGNADMIPSPNVYHDHDHVMDSDKLIGILKGAGVDNASLQKLGYDDLDKLEGEAQACKDGVAAAINKASEDQMRVGNRYPGGHLLNYAKAQMLDFYKPVLTWEMTYKKLLEALGRGQRHDPMEAWTIYHVDAADMGFKNQRDVPYMGSMVPGKLQKPLFIGLHDTSGSVDDAMLKRFISEGINMSRKMSRGNAPDVAHIFADTIARGEPVFITEKNYRQVLASGINYGGRGGTNFQASIENAFELVKPGGKRTPYSGRTIDALVYFTDTGDSAPDPVRLLAKAKECGMKKLPIILFVAPRSTYDERFKKAIEGWANIVYFDSGPKAEDKKQHINLDQLGRDQERKMAAVEAAAPAAPARKPRH
jgi:hypothetical protein